MATNLVVVGVYGKINNGNEMELKKLKRYKSFGQIKIDIEIRAIFLCILAQIFNELEGLLRMLGITIPNKHDLDRHQLKYS